MLRPRPVKTTIAIKMQLGRHLLFFVGPAKQTRGFSVLMLNSLQLAYANIHPSLASPLKPKTHGAAI